MREHAWTERLTPPPAPGASNQIGQNPSIPLSRTHGRTLSRATTVIPPRHLLRPSRWLGRWFPSLPSGPLAGCPARTTRVRRPPPLRSIVTAVPAAQRTSRTRWGIAASRRLRPHPVPLACRVARPRTVRLGRRPTQVDRPRASQPGSASLARHLRSSRRMWERGRTHRRRMRDRRPSERPRQPRTPSVDRRLRSKEARPGDPTARRRKRPVTGRALRPDVRRAPRPGVGSVLRLGGGLVLRSGVGGTRRAEMRRTRRPGLRGTHRPRMPRTRSSRMRRGRRTRRPGMRRGPRGRRAHRPRMRRGRRAHRSGLFLSLSPTVAQRRISSLTLNLRSRFARVQQRLHQRTDGGPEREPGRPTAIRRRDGRPGCLGRRKQHRQAFSSRGRGQSRTQRPTPVPLTIVPTIHPTATRHGRDLPPPLDPTHRRRCLPAFSGGAPRSRGEPRRRSATHRWSVLPPRPGATQCWRNLPPHPGGPHRRRDLRLHLDGTHRRVVLPPHPSETSGGSGSGVRRPDSGTGSAASRPLLRGAIRVRRGTSPMWVQRSLPSIPPRTPQALPRRPRPLSGGPRRGSSASRATPRPPRFPLSGWKALLSGLRVQPGHRRRAQLSGLWVQPRLWRGVQLSGP
jgi:hypothetical protein